jgi:hypothetical protein
LQKKCTELSQIDGSKLDRFLPLVDTLINMISLFSKSPRAEQNKLECLFASFSNN